MGGLRYYLDGQDVHAGDVLEIQLDDGAWRLVRFEWGSGKTEPMPWFIFQDSSGREVVLELTETTVARWLGQED